MDLTRTAQRLADLPSDGGHAVDVLAGANLRIFVRLKKVERAYSDLRARIATIEERSRPRPAAAHPVDPRLTKDGNLDRRGGTPASRHGLRIAQAKANGNGTAK